MDNAPRPAEGAAKIFAPMALLAELTHRCPLACPYCSNPLELIAAKGELSTDAWIDIFRQAADMGVLHLHLSGGEPAARRDLVELTKAAYDFGLYTNLITSGIGLTEQRMQALAEAGLDHVQLSLQGTSPQRADRVGGYQGGFNRKMDVANWVHALGLPLTVNAVCHRQNMDEIEDMLQLAITLGARRIEIATVQFHGWALQNLEALMPSRAQVERTTALVEEARERLKGQLVIDYVPADYYSTYPKACMGGWGRIGLNIAPDGRVLPCHAAETLPNLQFDNACEKPLADIWYGGQAFNAYRGEEWMPALCRACERKSIDFGGCRCQAMALAGDPSATDPICARSPKHKDVVAIAEKAAAATVPEGFVYRGR